MNDFWLPFFKCFAPYAPTDDVQEVILYEKMYDERILWYSELLL